MRVIVPTFVQVVELKFWGYCWFMEGNNKEQVGNIQLFSTSVQMIWDDHMLFPCAPHPNWFFIVLMSRFQIKHLIKQLIIVKQYLLLSYGR